MESLLKDVKIDFLPEYLKLLPDNDPTYISELSEIMTKYGSDKGGGLAQQFVLNNIYPPNCVVHNYTFFYEKLFESYRDKKLNIFEMGVGVPSCMASWAGSLLGWKEYFPNSKVYSADYDKDYLYNDDRIKSYYVDQHDENIINEMWNNDDLKDLNFDLIIDDGPHTYLSNILFYKLSINKLKLNGIYIIEDINYEFIDKLYDEINIFNNENNIKIEIVKLLIPFPVKSNHIDYIQKMNNLIFIKLISI